MLIKLATIGYLILASTNAQVPLERPEAARAEHAMLWPAIRDATKCIIAGTLSDKRFSQTATKELFITIIADAAVSCAKPLRVMVDKYDATYGEGSGWRFFEDVYLETLPDLILKAMQESATH